MNTKQLECCIRCDPILRKHILREFSADCFPKHLESFPCGFIVNTDNHLQPGTHWVTFYSLSRDTLEFLIVLEDYHGFITDISVNIAKDTLTI